MEDLRKSIAGWSLESDDRLLRALSTFSNKIVERTKEVNDCMETLNEETRATQSQLQNAFNRFLMLQSGQFIENRVVRDQETAKKIHEEKQHQQEEKINVNEQQSAAQIIETYKRALNLGMAAMEHTLPQSVLANALKSQQESIAAGISPTLPKCTKDKYNNQPLPYIIGTPQFTKNEDLGLFGAFNDTVFYNIIEEESEEEEDDYASSEAEDFDFYWMKQYISVLLPKFEDYYEPDNTKLYRNDLRNFFPESDTQQIDDIFEYFEDENGYDTADVNADVWISVTQIIQLFHESEVDDEERKKKKGARVAPGLAAVLNDGLSRESEDEYEPVKEHKKKKRKNSDKGASAAIFAAIDDFDTSSDDNVGGGVDGFFNSDKKTDIRDFGLSDDDTDDDFGIAAALSGDRNKKKKEKEEKKENESKIISDPFADSDSGFDVDERQHKDSDRKPVDPFADSNDESDGGFGDIKPKSVRRNIMFDDSDEESEDRLLQAKVTNKKKSNVMAMFDDTDDDDDVPSETPVKTKVTSVKSRGNAIFADSDDDDDPLFSSSKPKPKPKQKKVDLDENDDPLKDKEEDKGEMSKVGIKIDVHKLNNRGHMTVTQIKALKAGKGMQKESTPKKNLMFGDSDDDDDPLFSSFSSKAKQKKASPKSDDPLSSLKSEPKQEKVDLEEKDDPLEDNGEMSKIGIKIDVHKLNMGPRMTVKQIKALKAKTNTKVDTKTNVMFNDSDDSDDMFSNKLKEKPLKTETKTKKNVMFNDSEDDIDEDFDVKPKATKPIKNDLFAFSDDNDEDEEDTFSNKKKEKEKEKVPKQKEKKVPNLFDDDDDDLGDIFASSTKKNWNKNVAAIFGDSDDDDDFVIKKKKKKGKKGKKKIKSLFDLNSDDEDQLMTQKHKTNAQSPPKLPDVNDDGDRNKKKKENKENKENEENKKHKENEENKKHNESEENKESKISDPFRDSNDELNQPKPQKQPKHKMNAKLAAKFGGLNIDPRKMKVGAAPIKRRKEKQEMDQSMVLNKVTIKKTGRRKRSKRKVKIDDHNDSHSFYAVQNDNIDNINETNKKEEVDQEKTKEKSTADNNPLASTPPKDNNDSNDHIKDIPESKSETKKKEDLDQEKPKRKSTDAELDALFGNDNEHVVEHTNKKEQTPPKGNDPLFEDTNDIDNDADQENTDDNDYNSPLIHSAPPKDNDPFGIDHIKDIPESKSESKKKDDVDQEKPKRKSTDAEIDALFGDTDNDSNDPLGIDTIEGIDNIPESKLQTKKKEDDELDALFGDEDEPGSDSKPEPKKVSKPVVKEVVPSPAFDADVESESEPETVQQKQDTKETSNIFDDSDSDDWLSNKTFNKTKFKSNDFDSLFD